MGLNRPFFLFADMKSYPKCLLQSEVSILNPKKCNEAYFDKNYKVKTMICASVSYERTCFLLNFIWLYQKVEQVKILTF